MSARTLITWAGAPLLGAYLGVVTIQTVSGMVGKWAPEIETAISPVIRVQPVKETDTYRDAGKVCWFMTITKRHAAVPIRYDFFAETSLFGRTKITLTPYFVDDKLHKMKSADLTTHPVGETWRRHYCADLDRRIDDLDIRIGGTAFHRRHALYDTPTPIPMFNVPAAP